MQTQTEKRLQVRLDERDQVQTSHEELLREAGDADLSDIQKKQATAYRERALELDTEITELQASVDADRQASERSREIRRAMAGRTDGIDVEDDGVVYRSMAAYARDVILTGTGRVAGQIAAQLGDKTEIQRASERLDLMKRTPANTLSSNVGGLTPAQHIAQIFQIIDKSRPIVESASRATLERGVLTYPKVTTRPVVAVQGTQKTEAGNTGMVVDLQTATASTYLGGGDLSWQAINWSTPNALDLWFDLIAADYALKTEQDAAQVIQHSGFSNNIATTLGATPTFAEVMTAVGAAYGEVFANSGRLADTLYVAPDRYGYVLGLTSNAFTQFTQVSAGSIGPYKIVVSRGMDAGVIVVGDSSALLVAETAGAPVELRVVEPAIGGVEVGLIGAFEAVVTDNGAFTMLTTAS